MGWAVEDKGKWDSCFRRNDPVRGRNDPVVGAGLTRWWGLD